MKKSFNGYITIEELKETIPIEIQRVLLVDDVITSSATLNECAKVLRIEGVTKIYCVGAARTG